MDGIIGFIINGNISKLSELSESQSDDNNDVEYVLENKVTNAGCS